MEIIGQTSVGLHTGDLLPVANAIEATFHSVPNASPEGHDKAWVSPPNPLGVAAVQGMAGAESYAQYLRGLAENADAVGAHPEQLHAVIDADVLWGEVMIGIIQDGFEDLTSGHQDRFTDEEWRGIEATAKATGVALDEIFTNIERLSAVRSGTGQAPSIQS